MSDSDEEHGGHERILPMVERAAASSGGSGGGTEAHNKKKGGASSGAGRGADVGRRQGSNSASEWSESLRRMERAFALLQPDDDHTISADSQQTTRARTATLSA